MDHLEMQRSPEELPRGAWLRSRSGIVFLLFVAVAGYFLLTEHRAHVLQALPWLLVAACPLMHLFHHGHGGHGHTTGDTNASRDRS